MLDTSKIKKVQIKHNTRGASTKGVLTIINSQKNGKRITLSKEIFDELSEPTSVVVGFYEDKLLITSTDLKEAIGGTVCVLGKNRNIYCTDLVEKITDLFNLDFSERVSITLSTLEWEELDGQPVALLSNPETTTITNEEI